MKLKNFVSLYIGFLPLTTCRHILIKIYGNCKNNFFDEQAQIDDRKDKNHKKNRIQGRDPDLPLEEPVT